MNYLFAFLDIDSKYMIFFVIFKLVYLEYYHYPLNYM